MLDTDRREAMLIDRGPQLPPGASRYRVLGPFMAQSIPQGLMREHRLKPGAWGMVRIIAGSIDFRWDDPQGGLRRLDAGMTLLVPPQVPHHLEPRGDVTLEIEFWT